jgi:hypothetical protein
MLLKIRDEELKEGLGQAFVSVAKKISDVDEKMKKLNPQ